MDALSKLSREAQAVLVGGVVLLILSFFPWQKVSFSFGDVGGSVSFNEWHGIGVLAVLFVIAMIIWEVLRMMAVNVSIGTVSPGLVSLGLAALASLLTVVAFINKDTFRTWTAWGALIVAILVAAAAVMRSRAEGVQMPQGKPAGSTGSAEPAASASPTEPTDAPPE